MITRRFHAMRRGSRVVVLALMIAGALIAAIFLCLIVGCTPTAGLRPTEPLYAPGGYADRMHIQRTPYFPAPCRRR